MVQTLCPRKNPDIIDGYEKGKRETTDLNSDSVKVKNSDQGENFSALLWLACGIIGDLRRD